jgi:transposase
MTVLRYDRRKEARMTIIAFDSHKHYTQVCVEDDSGGRPQESRIRHRRGAFAAFLCGYEPGCPVAVETIGNWYWIIDEIEQAGMRPLLVHARKAKLMHGCVNKTDKLDARGINMLQRAGTLPAVWIPPADLRDKRELCRARMSFSAEKTRLKNRIHSMIDKYGMQDIFEDCSDIFSQKASPAMNDCIRQLPEHTRYVVRHMLQQLKCVVSRIEQLDKRIQKVYQKDRQTELLETLYGVGPVLSVVIAQEMGDVNRFADASHFASYCGVCPRVHSSGGKTYYGRMRDDVNHYLKCAFCEAANVVARNYRKHPDRHLSKIYARLHAKHGHGKAIGAVARHMAQAAWWMLKKQEPYREPSSRLAASTTAI